MRYNGVRREYFMAEQAKDGAKYVRQQKGHSALLAIFIIGPLTAFILPIYWLVSPNHYYHL